MSEPHSTCRRRFIQASIASLGLTALGRPAQATAAQPAIIAAARAALERAGAHVVHRDLVGLADFRQPSRLPRLHLVDLAGGKVDSLLVAHGRGSDPNHTGWLSAFSNTPGSAATSEGAYVTGDYYIGQHGRSMRLLGMDPTNSNANSRGIVVHAAKYVAPDIVREQGMLGRSEGCFAVSQSDLPEVLERLGPGRLLVAGKL
jgi:hypothetical protein